MTDAWQRLVVTGHHALREVSMRVGRKWSYFDMERPLRRLSESAPEVLLCLRRVGEVTMEAALSITTNTSLFLDLDGTLTDLVPYPEVTPVALEVLVALDALSSALNGAVAIISGRPLEQIDAALYPLRLPAAGVHGMERRDAEGVVRRMPAPALYLAERSARRLATRHGSLRMEHKYGAVALHYGCAPELESLCIKTLEQATRGVPGLALLRGKNLIEVKPIEFTKGTAVRDFMNEAPFAGRRPIYVGDDVSDEDGFLQVQLGNGCGFKIGGGPTSAHFRLSGPGALRAELEREVRQLTRPAEP